MPKVLLVEDDNNLREIFEMRLQAEGYQTVTASDGEEGLTVAMKEKPDLIISDVMMPKLSGFEMLETLRAAPDMKDTKVVMMTALGQAEDRTRGEGLGVVKYLVKSQATLEDFARVIQEVLPVGQAGQTTAQGPGTESSQNNNQERQDNMQEDQSANNPAAPSGDTPAPADNTTPTSNPVSGDTPATSPVGDTGQLGSTEEQSAVQNQIDNFVQSAPAGGSDTPAADAAAAPATPGAPDMGGPASTDAPSVPVSTPPAEDAPAAPAESDKPAEGGDANAPTTGTV